MEQDRVPPVVSPCPPRWAEALLRFILKPDDRETVSGDLLEAYRDSLYPALGRRRANLWYVRQAAGYVLRTVVAQCKANAVTFLLIFLAAGVVLFFMLAIGGIAVLGTLAGSAAVTIAAPALWFQGNRRPAAKLLARWGAYLAFYVSISTGMALLRQHHERPRGLGEEVCADSGCFGVDRVERSASGSMALFTLSWHLSSNDKETSKRFPGKELALYLFDERGRKYRLPATANQNPLDRMLPAGGTFRDLMTFSVSADAQELYLTAEYRPFTFQSLFPGTLSVLPHRPPAMIRIQ